MHHLTQEERYQIYAYRAAGHSLNSIAQELGRAKSTISQEIARNTGGRGYRPRQAHERARARRHAASSRPRKLTPEVVRYLEEKLQEEWSPEQIAGRMDIEGGTTLHHETVYRYVSRDKEEGGTLYRHLRRASRVYKKRYGGRDSRGRLKDCTSITERPKEVEKRRSVGHWEIDTVRRTDGKGSLVTIVERRTRLTRVAEVPSLHAQGVADATIELLKGVKPFVHSITADNGREFALHALIAKRLHADFYFAQPYHSWERGTNENTNGLIRQYLPKRKVRYRFTSITTNDIEQKLNTRPRKTLGFLTPLELFQKETGYFFDYQ